MHFRAQKMGKLQCHGHFGRFYHNFANFTAKYFVSFRDGEADSCPEALPEANRLAQ